MPTEPTALPPWFGELLRIIAKAEDFDEALLVTRTGDTIAFAGYGPRELRIIARSDPPVIGVTLGLPGGPKAKLRAVEAVVTMADAPPPPAPLAAAQPREPERKRLPDPEPDPESSHVEDWAEDREKAEPPPPPRKGGGASSRRR